MIGIKLADGTFYPILEDGKAAKKRLSLTTAENGQTTVQVDLYKSKTSSMDDAVYVDSLLIENLIPHKKNEPEIPLVLGLDDNNILSAEISDEESGKTSNMSVALVTLSDDKLKSVPDFNVLDSTANSDSSDLDNLTPPNLTDDLSLPDFDFPTEETLNPLETPSESFDTLETPTDFTETPEAVDTVETVDSTPSLDDFSLPDDLLTEPTQSFDTLETPTDSTDTPEAVDTVEAVDSTPSLDDFSLPDDILTEPTESFDTLETPAESVDSADSTPSLDDFTLPDDIPTEPTDSFDTLETPADTVDSSDSTPSLDDFTLPDDIPTEPTDSFDTLETPADTVDSSDSTPSLDDFTLPDDIPTEPTDSFDTLETPAEAPTFEDEVSSLTDDTESNDTTSDDDFDFSDSGALELGSDIEEPPEIVKQQQDEIIEQNDSPTPSQEELSDESSSFDTNEMSFPEPETDVNTDQEAVLPDNNDDSFRLPDFDFPNEPETTEPLQNDTTFESEQESFSQPESTNDMSFDFPNDEENIATSSKPTNNFNRNVEPSLGFQDLYDEETLQGMTQHSSKKSIVPMIICIICAVVSVIALLGILYFVPSHIDISVKQQEPVIAEPVTSTEILSEPIPQEVVIPEEEVIPAPPVENAIIISETAEIVPIIPQEPPKKSQDVTHKIKWGDTLWDLAATYYKNPWKYHKIAKANGIKDPDYIISGTYITIPSE